MLFFFFFFFFFFFCFARNFPKNMYLPTWTNFSQPLKWNKRILILTCTSLSLPTRMAVCNTVSPASSFKVTSALCSSNISTMLNCFAKMAVWRGVLPELSWRFVSWKSMKRREINRGLLVKLLLQTFVWINRPIKMIFDKKKEEIPVVNL